MIQCKFRVMWIQDHGHGATVHLSAQYDNTIPEDRRFAQATPSGDLEMFVNNPAALAELQPEREFYLNFVPVDQVLRQG